MSFSSLGCQQALYFSFLCLSGFLQGFVYILKKLFFRDTFAKLEPAKFGNTVKSTRLVF